ncbi:host specificity protein J [Stenotrophomonas sp. 24(2023)]|uniref:host specificity protein J n=1 Tax=Stenotrophomonas sp. 24(2023) TaxID=3068324 RepID=UPI0027DF6518|nr:host specificity protein J [Stenotrophomonas sp. 24(2023)]WMJ68733.1 host specificity protein J [Stenotrophomonas sp. 24(2023)]
MTPPSATVMRKLPIVGAKKGQSKGREPVEAPDSLRSMSYARVLDLISEGEIRGLVAGNQSIYLDQVPIQNADGGLNFQNVRVDTRAGTQEQTSIPGFPSVENEVPVNVELRSNTPVTRSISGVSLSAVRVRLAVPALQKINSSNGEIDGYSISYAIDLSTNNGPFTTILTAAFSGKTTTPYERSHRIDLPEGSQWQVRIRRLTPNANSSTIADTVTVVSLTEVIDAKLRYPNCAIAAVQVDASQFQSKPTTAYRIWGRIIQVPTNYDPMTRTYTGSWDGTFKAAWTNNPAWVFYDIVTNDRFGLGHRIPQAYVDKWNLYAIARYCDQLVSDGMGGMEPRFTCSLYLQTEVDAFRVLQDMASMFRGISFYAAGQVLASADMPRDPAFTYTQANVVAGRFTYEGTSRRSRHTVAQVSWTDPDDFGRQKVEAVQLRSGIARYGINSTSVIAFGCHSRGQAQRIGNHILVSEGLETETVAFSVGLDALRVSVGDVIRVADPDKTGRRMGGRARSAGASTLVVDRVPDGAAAGHTLHATLPNGRTETRTIQAITGNEVRLTVPWSALPVAESTWAMESPELVLQLFRVMSITESDDGATYNVVGLKHVPGKFAAIDDGTRIELPPVSIIPPSVQLPPASVKLSAHSIIDQGIATHILTIAWEQADKAIAYDVEWRRGDLDWVRAGRVSTQSIEVRGVYSGQYLARVRGINAVGAISQPALSPLTTIAGKTTLPPALASLTTTPLPFAIALGWAFPPGATDTERTEIWRSTGPNRVDAVKLGDYAYPQNRLQLDGLAAGVRFYFWGRLVDRSGNIGPWYPASTGVMGEASSKQSDYDAYFVGKISESALGKSLQSKIGSISGLVPLVWTVGGAYEPGQTVVHNGRIWQWKGPGSGNETPPGTKWLDVGQAVTDAGSLIRRVDQLDLRATEVDGKVAAVGQQVSGLVAQHSAEHAGDDDWNAGDETSFAGTITTLSIVASGDYALSKRVETTEVTVGETGAMVEQNTQAVADLKGRISASWNLKLQINANGQYYAAGMGIGIENQPDGSFQSQILFQADRFALVNVINGNVTSPFVIHGGQTFISQALIGDAWITNAMIGSEVKSNAIDSQGRPLWRLDKGGVAEFNAADGSGSSRFTGREWILRDSNGVARVEIGL